MATKAQKRAQARYDAKRPKGVLVRLNEEERAALDKARREGESMAALIKQVLMSACSDNAGHNATRGTSGRR